MQHHQTEGGSQPILASDILRRVVAGQTHLPFPSPSDQSGLRPAFGWIAALRLANKVTGGGTCLPALLLLIKTPAFPPQAQQRRKTYAQDLTIFNDFPKSPTLDVFIQIVAMPAQETQQPQAPQMVAPQPQDGRVSSEQPVSRYFAATQQIAY